MVRRTEEGHLAWILNRIVQDIAAQAGIHTIIDYLIWNLTEKERWVVGVWYESKKRVFRIAVNSCSSIDSDVIQSTDFGNEGLFRTSKDN